mmetsp:Transcript_16190/g.32554  ORF Transcript_16190/g.32554 Transcript_16190/m.32554 type:complete len:201 (+) Transcript_16190:4410-5012(+)
MVHVNNGFVNTSNPPTQFTRRIEVLWLHLGGKFLLTCSEKLNHGFSDDVSFTLQLWEQLHDTAVECSIDLRQRIPRWEVYEKERGVTEESRRQHNTTSISRRVARTNELDAISFDPHIILSPEPSLFHKLPHEHDHSLRTVRILLWEIDFVAKDNEPVTRSQTLNRLKNNIFSFSHIRTILRKSLHDNFRCCARGEVQAR